MSVGRLGLEVTQPSAEQQAEALAAVMETAARTLHNVQLHCYRPRYFGTHTPPTTLLPE